VFLKVKEKRSSLKLGSFPKLAGIYYGSFEILKRICPIPYMIPLIASMIVHNVFHASILNKYVSNSNHVIDCTMIQVEHDGDF
jgi:hypothetical protein